MPFSWLSNYPKTWFAEDLRIALFATLILIPQALAYAVIAGLPPYYGLYASLLPLVIYALFGSSPVLSVGPVAIISLITASSLAPLADNIHEMIQLAALITLLSGLMLLVFGIFRLGSVAYLLSQPVVSGFISGSAIIIIISQIGPLLGLKTHNSHNIHSLYQGLVHSPQPLSLTAAIGLSSLTILIIARKFLTAGLMRLGLKAHTAQMLNRCLPMLLVIISGFLTTYFHWQENIAVIGEVPKGLPPINLSFIQLDKISPLILPAFFIALIGFVQSIAIARVAAAKNHQKVLPNKELYGLGASNIGSAFCGGLPVFGSFTRTAITMDGGSYTPMANYLTAIFLAILLIWGSSLLAYLPLSVLAATIIVAVFNLIDIKTFKQTWQYSKTDAFTLAATFLTVIFADVEKGIITGIALSLFSVIWRASYPHIAVVGRIPGTEHFRNIQNYAVETDESILMLRIDENLFFGNANSIEEHIYQELSKQPTTKHVVLLMSSVSHIDSTALAMLEKLNDDLSAKQIVLHLAELKNTVLKPLQTSLLIHQLTGEIFLTASNALDKLSKVTQS